MASDASRAASTFRQDFVRSSRSPGSEGAQDVQQLRRRLDDYVGTLAQGRGPFGRADGHPHREIEAVERGERVQICRVVAGVEGAGQPGAFEEVRDGRSLARV